MQIGLHMVEVVNSWWEENRSNKEKERMGRPEQFITPHQLDSGHCLSHSVRV